MRSCIATAGPLVPGTPRRTRMAGAAAPPGEARPAGGGGPTTQLRSCGAAGGAQAPSHARKASPGRLSFLATRSWCWLSVRARGGCAGACCEWNAGTCACPTRLLHPRAERLTHARRSCARTAAWATRTRTGQRCCCQPRVKAPAQRRRRRAQPQLPANKAAHATLPTTPRRTSRRPSGRTGCVRRARARATRRTTPAAACWAGARSLAPHVAGHALPSGAWLRHAARHRAPRALPPV